jgi:hypothetical protein
MAAPKRTKAQREADLAETARMYCSGYRQADIATVLDVSQAQISLDLKAIFADWRKQRDGEITQWTNEELAKINALELEYWEAWRRSCADRKRVVKEQRKGPPATKGGTATQTSRAAVTEESMLGNPAFLGGVQWCIERRCKILGIDAPTKVAPTTPDGMNPYAGVPDDVLHAELVRYALAFGTAAGGAALSLDDERSPESTAAAR